ncbi:MAG: OadG family transporter subunit [Thalassotalea sp.]|nr:OadG family transporter subunit [Thalassotalea sp.]
MDNLTELFVEAGTLMLAGMVFVFAFLGILIIFINKVLVKLAIKFPDPIIQSKPQRKSNKTNVDKGGISPPVAAAISSAVHQYRQQHSTNK